MVTRGEQLEPFLCARCAAELLPGAGNFYEIKIEALADPTPPVLPDRELHVIRQEMEQVLEELREVSPQEALDQVYRRLTIHLCIRCYTEWIENPAG